MTDDYDKRVRAMSPAKAFTIAAYGESVAAYRYRTLAEKATSDARREIFEEMAVEEQGHHQRIEALIRKHFPNTDFVLAAEDKELVIVGPRMLEISDAESYDQALEMIWKSERRTGSMYAALHACTTDESLRPFLKEMADECIEHAERLKSLPA